MFRQSAMLILKLAFLRSLVTHIATTAAATPPLDGCKVKLFVNNFQPSPNSILADFTEATFAGYAEVTIAAWGATINTGGSKAGTHAQADFTAGAIVGDGETAYGYYVTNAAEDTLFFAEKFAVPAPFAQQFDSLSLDVIFSLDAYLASL